MADWAADVKKYGSPDADDKVLALTQDDAALEQAITGIGETLKCAHNKNRVTVYYLLAEKSGKLALFG